MRSDFEDNLNEDFFINSKYEKTSKDDILDINLEKAKDIHGINKKRTKKEKKKPFLKSGIVLLILSLICIGLIIAPTPWGYIKSESETLGDVEKFSGIPIDTVGIGAGSTWYDPELLRKISEITGGIFCEVDNVEALAKTILQLAPTNRPLLGTIKGGD